MKEFMSLEQFLLMEEDHHSIYYKSSEVWVYWYRLAKASFEQFGENGPPVGSKVITLVNGHCGNGFDFRIFVGNDDGDERFFQLKRNNDDCSGISLVEKSKWWKQIVSLDPPTVGWGELPDCISKRNRFGKTDLESIAEFIALTR